MAQPYHAPPHASFLQKLGPGGAASLGLALLTSFGFLGLPWLYRLRQVLLASKGEQALPADAILVLGRRLEADQITAVFAARLAQAEALWRQGAAPRILVAGGATGTSSLSEAEAGLAWLLTQGVPETAVLLEDRSQHTLENLFNVRSQMQERGWQSLLLVSDPLHLSRARATAEGLSLQVACVPAEHCPPRRGSASWWGRAAQEAFLLHWYHTGMLYSRLIRSERQLERVT